MADHSGDETTRKGTINKDDKLTITEEWWRDHYDLLESHGYRLRPRYRPGWVPSWRGTGKSPLRCEDNIFNLMDYVMDATRIKDGTAVSIKRLSRRSKELSIALFLSSSGDAATDPKNHCVPIVDHFNDESLPQFSFLVMPLLRWFDDPPFFSVDEVIDFIKQTLEGLEYMHRQNVAHRDCADLNIMLDAPSMYPRGFHPASQIMDASGTKIAPFRRRRDVDHVKYYFIDFGLATQFEAGMKESERLVTGVDCQDRDVPELSYLRPYDPFRVDVFILGNVYRKKFLDKYENLSFLSPLVDSMTRLKPEERPSAAKALSIFHNQVTSQSSVRLRWRLRKKDIGFVSLIFQDIGSITREGLYLSKRLIISTHFYQKIYHSDYYISDASSHLPGWF